MYVAMDDLPPADRYRLLVNTVVPRPIAWVATHGPAGGRNLAPFSFFNALCSAPPILGVGIGRDGVRDGADDKDTLAAIRAKGEFVIALVGEDQAEAMNLTATAAPPGVDEFTLAGLEAGKAGLVDAPIVKGAPVNFECRVWQLLEPAPHNAIVLGEVVAVHMDERFVDRENGKLRIDSAAMNLVARAHGSGWYWRGGDMLQIQRKGWPLD